MRTFTVITACVFVGLSAPLLAQDKGKTPDPRYGVAADADRFPQSTPKEALASIVRALDEKRFDYFLAYLADPVTIDAQVGDKKAADDFGGLVRMVTERFKDDPSMEADLKHLHKDGTWDEKGEQATVRAGRLTGKIARFKKVHGRWVLENRREG